MTERWVPTGREYDEGTQSPLAPENTRRRGRLLDRVLGRTKRRARQEIDVRPGVGEARTVVQPPPSVRPAGAPAGTPTKSVTPADLPSAASLARPTPQVASPKVDRPGMRDAPIQPAGPRRRRRTTIRPGVAPEIGARPKESQERLGTWPEHMTNAEMRRQIGHTQNYDDAT